MLEKTLESPFDCKEIQPVHPKGNQSWVFVGRTDAEAEIPILWPRQRMRWLDGITDSKDEFEHAQGVGYGQGSLASCGPWGYKESDATEGLSD